MAAGQPTVMNSTAQWNNLTRLAPMVWLEGARVALETVRSAMDLYYNDQLDQFNRDYGSIASSGFGHTINEGSDYIARFNNEGDTLSLNAVKRGDAFTVTEDLMDGNKYRDIKFGLERLGGSLFRQMARDGTHFAFTFGGSSNFTDADGNTISNGVAKGSEPIFDDTHTMADASTYANEFADTAIGETSIRSMEDLTTSFVDENGESVEWGTTGVKYLVHGRDTPVKHQAKKLTEQEYNLGSAERDMNLFKGEYMRKELFYLNSLASGKPDSTKDKYYFIVDGDLMQRLSLFGIHTRPTPRGPFEDTWNGGMLWRSKARYDIGTQAAHIGVGCFATS